MTGHKPFGDSPVIMRLPSLEVISADTSYSDTSALDMRGIAVSEVIVRGTLQENQAQVHGVLKDGTEFDFVLPTLGSDNSVNNSPGDEWIGRETPSGWWVKAKLEKDPSHNDTLSYILVKGSGHKVEYKTVPLSQLPTLFAENETKSTASL